MATDMGRGIMAPNNNENIGTGASEMRTIAATTVAAINALDADKVSLSEAAQYGIEGPRGPQGKPGPEGKQGIPGVEALPADEAVSEYLETEVSQTGQTARALFANRETTPSASTASASIFVDPGGSDSNNGSKDYPLKSISSAIARIPDIVRAGHHYKVVLGPGDYDEDVLIQHKIVTGQITIGGETEARGLYRVRPFLANQVLGRLVADNMKATVKNIDGNRGFEFRACTPFMYLTNVENTPDDGGPRPNSRGFLADYGSIVRVTDSDFSGKRYGIRSNYQSQVYSNNNTGTGNEIGGAARWGGVLTSYYGGLPDGDQKISTNSGGIISLGHGGIIGAEQGNDERALISVENYRDNGVSAKKWAFTYESIPSYMIDGISIPRNSPMRIRFRVPRDGTSMILRVKWLARNTVQSFQSHESTHHVFLRQNSITGESVPLLFTGRDMNSDSAKVEARGSLSDIYLIIDGVQSYDHQWALRVEMESDRLDMPFFAGAELV